MRNLFNRLASYVRQSAAALAVGAALGSLLTAPIAVFALNVPAQYAPRYFQTQQTHYVRASLQFTSCVQVSNACTIKIPAALPYNAMVVRVTYVISTAFNSTTSDTLSIGVTSANANEIVAAATIHGQAITAETVTATASSATGNGATQTGLDGGFDLFMKWTAGTGNTATTGNMAAVIEYIAPNDGTCAAVPLNATATGC